jgi:hypothetical protein
LFLEFLVLLISKEGTDMGLHPREDLGETVITEFFKLTQNTSTEEYLLDRSGQ